LGRGQVSDLHLVLETDGAVAAIAERLIFRVAAAAECDGSAPAEAESATLLVDDFKIAFDAQRAVVVHDDSGCGQFISSSSRT